MDCMNYKTDFLKKIYESADQWAINYRYRVSIFEWLNKFNENVDIVFVGDSITELYPVNEMYSGKVANRGISGDVIEGLLNRMDESIFDLNPKKVVFLMGTNDIGKDYTVNQVLENTALVFKQIKEKLPSCEIFAISVYSVNRSNHPTVKMTTVTVRTNEDIDEINDRLQVLCEKSNINFININPFLKDETGNLKIEYTTDGLHITAKGYEFITKKIQDVIYRS